MAALHEDEMKKSIALVTLLLLTGLEGLALAVPCRPGLFMSNTDYYRCVDGRYFVFKNEYQFWRLYYNPPETAYPKKKPTPKPRVTIDWAHEWAGDWFCLQITTGVNGVPTATNLYKPPYDEVFSCSMELGFGSDGIVYWRNPQIVGDKPKILHENEVDYETTAPFPHRRRCPGCEHWTFPQ